MDTKTIKEWTLNGALDKLESINNEMLDRPFVFILGAGASVTSGIPSGKALAEKWLLELHSLECHDHETTPSGLGPIYTGWT